MAKMSALVIALMAVLAYGTAEATVFVVDPTPPACVQPSGGVLVPTIGDAVTAAAAGDRIYVCPGTYAENVVVQPAQSNLTLLGIGRPLVTPGDSGRPGFMILASGVRLQGFEVAGFQNSQGIVVGDPYYVQSIPHVSGVIVIANVVHGNRMGILFFYVAGNEARDNTVEGNSETGIWVWASWPSVTRSNLVIGNRVRRNGTGVDLSSSFARVDMNEVSENGLGIYSFQAGGVISRNTVTKNGNYGIVADADYLSVPLELDHNAVRENDRTGMLVRGVRADCSVTENTVARNRGTGLDVEVSCQVLRNVVQQNYEWGIVAGPIGEYEGQSVFMFNTASGNSYGNPDVFVDCYWQGWGAVTFADNRCTTETPPGAWD